MKQRAADEFFLRIDPGHTAMTFSLHIPQLSQSPLNIQKAPCKYPSSRADDMSLQKNHTTWKPLRSDLGGTDA